MKYFGGKNRLGKHITKIINNFIDEETTYIEPFVGGGGLLQYINQPKEIYINDNHKYLMEMWEKLYEGWFPSNEWNPKDLSRDQYLVKGREIYDELKKFKNGNNTSKYTNAFIGYFGFNACFSGKWFGGFATHTKTQNNYFISSYLPIQLKVCKLLNTQKTVIDNLDIFDYFKKYNFNNATIYLDPPYLKTTGYTTGEMNYTEFWNIVRELSKTNWVFISEEQAPDDFIDVYSNMFTRSLKDSDGKNIIAKEKLFIHRDRVIEYNNIMNKKDILGGI